MNEDMNFNKENEEINNEEVNENVLFDVENTVGVVPVEESKKNNKTTLIIVAVILVAVICGLVFFFTQKGGDDSAADVEAEVTDTSFWGDIDYQALEDALEEESFTDTEGQQISKDEYAEYIQSIVNEATTTISEDVGSVSPVIIGDGNASDSKELEVSDVCTAQVKGFLDRSCYMEGALYDEAGGSPITIAFDGDNFEMATNLEGIEVSVLRIDGAIYFKRTALKQYCELTDAVMEMFGLSMDLFDFDFGDVDYDAIKDNLVGITAVTVNGQEGVCYEYNKTESDFFKFYFVNDELVELDIGTNGQVDTQFIMSKFSLSIPGDMLTLKGYESAAFLSMFADLM